MTGDNMLTIYMYLGFLGASIASFLGVIISRLPKGESFIGGRSHCETCNRDLGMIELIPIFSYIAQRGQCRKCGTKLSPRYLIIEILGAFIFTISFFVHGWNLDTLYSILFGCILLVVAYIDLDTMLIYDRFNILILVLALIKIIISSGPFPDALIGLAIVCLPLSILSLKFNAMGFGDVKLLASSAFLLGTQSLIVAFIIAVILGGIHGIILIKSKKADSKSVIPFAPYLCIGLFIASLYGQQMATWYLSLIVGL